VFQLR